MSIIKRLHEIVIAQAIINLNKETARKFTSSHAKKIHRNDSGTNIQSSYLADCVIVKIKTASGPAKKNINLTFLDKTHSLKSCEPLKNYIYIK